MQYEIYNPTKHTLEVGTKIRLGGREGEIFTYSDDSWFNEIHWSNGDIVEFAGLKDFPLLEIAISPRTIDKRVKERISGPINYVLNKRASNYSNISVCAADALKAIEEISAYLNSLEET